tara:strand:+ start:20 stop:472 length:453 start_codon:yes stop_codon:yes gene_type:complete
MSSTLEIENSDSDSESFNTKSDSISLDVDVNSIASELASELTSINEKITNVNLYKKYEIISNVNTYNNYYKSNKKSTPYLTKYEKAKILGVRAQMISNGSPAMINVPGNITSTYDIALLEFKEDKIPLLIRRFLPNGNYEDWRLEDMVLK